MERRAKARAWGRLFAPMRRMSRKQILHALPWITEQARLAVENGERRERAEQEWQNMALLGEDAANQHLRSIGVDDLTAKYVTAPLS